MARLVGERLLDEDVVDYLTFRAVCSGWRASTSGPDGVSTLSKPHLRPRDWVALCDGDAALLDKACREITFFHTRTAHRLRVRLPELRSHRVVGFTDGLLILLHRRKTTVRVIHPFTRAMVDLPPLAPAFHKWIKDRGSLLDMTAFVCYSPGPPYFSVVAYFPCKPVALWTQPGREGWKVIQHGLEIENILPFQGMLFATVRSKKQIVMVYPPRDLSLAYAADSLADQEILCEYLVESAGRMMLVVQHTTITSAVDFKVFEVDLTEPKLLPICSLDDQALFLHADRCLCVSTVNLPSICSNSVYFSLAFNPVVMQSLSTGLCEDLSALREIHNMEERIRPSVRPFTIADHLLTYCHHLEWARGLMFHEYHHLPESFKDLQNKIQAEYSQVRIPQAVAGGAKSKLCHNLATKELLPRRETSFGLFSWSR